MLEQCIRSISNPSAHVRNTITFFSILDYLLAFSLTWSGNGWSRWRDAPICVCIRMQKKVKWEIGCESLFLACLIQKLGHRMHSLHIVPVLSTTVPRTCTNSRHYAMCVHVYGTVIKQFIERTFEKSWWKCMSTLGSNIEKWGKIKTEKIWFLFVKNAKRKQNCVCVCVLMRETSTRS